MGGRLSGGGDEREAETHTGTYTQTMFRRLQFAQVDLPSHLIFRPKSGPRSTQPHSGRQHKRRGGPLQNWQAIGVRLGVICSSPGGRAGYCCCCCCWGWWWCIWEEGEKAGERVQQKPDLLRAHHGGLRVVGGGTRCGDGSNLKDRVSWRCQPTREVKMPTSGNVSLISNRN